MVREIGYPEMAKIAGLRLEKDEGILIPVAHSKPLTQESCEAGLVITYPSWEDAFGSPEMTKNRSVLGICTVCGFAGPIGKDKKLITF